MPRGRSNGEERLVSITTGMSRLDGSCLILRQSSYPSMPVMTTSSSERSYLRPASKVCASAAEAVERRTQLLAHGAAVVDDERAQRVRYSRGAVHESHFARVLRRGMRRREVGVRRRHAIGLAGPVGDGIGEHLEDRAQQRRAVDDETRALTDAFAVYDHYRYDLRMTLPQVGESGERGRRSGIDDRDARRAGERRIACTELEL